MAREIDPALSRYISSVHQLPKLSREEEEQLARRWADAADPSAADAIVRAHLRYVVAIALKYRRYAVPLSELIAEGNFGVVHALKKFDPSRGNRFVTYAAYWIRAYILNYIIRSWSLVGVGSGALRSKLFFKLRRERIRIANLIGDEEAAEALLAERLGLPADQVGPMLRRLEQRDLSLDAKVYSDASTTLADTLEADGQDHGDRLAEEQLSEQAKLAVQAALADLDPRERYIAEHRMMADSEDELSLAEIGRRLGVSRERARQLEARAKRKLRVRIGEISRRASAPLRELDTAA
jgi:RNA polymerase sigma-32 factor